MAGEGSRFINEGWNTPKPLISLNGKVLFQRAISSVYIDGVEIKYSFIVREEHIQKYNIDSKIKEIIPKANIFSVKRTTRGAVETCLLAESVIDNEDAVLIMDCDLEFKSNQFKKKIKEILSKSTDNVDGGLLVSFDSIEARYSYAEIDNNFKVLRTAEKEVISMHALCGAYFFSKAEGFLYAANKLINDLNFNKPELYVSLLYNYLIQQSELVTLIKLEEYHSYGTPKELKNYL